jgi:hypothetical protein
MGCLTPYLRSFDRVLRGQNKSPRAREIYLDRAAKLDAWLGTCLTRTFRLSATCPGDNIGSL